jgi:hypothetical protein
MTTITNVGLTALDDALIDPSAARIDTLAIGTATGSEAPDATALGAEVFRSDIADGNVELVQTGGGERELTIRVSGGSDVAGGTTVSEVGVIVGGAGGGGVLAAIDNFSGVTIETGDVESFSIPFSPERVI